MRLSLKRLLAFHIQWQQAWQGYIDTTKKGLKAQSTTCDKIEHTILLHFIVRSPMAHEWHWCKSLVLGTWLSQCNTPWLDWPGFQIKHLIGRTEILETLLSLFSFLFFFPIAPWSTMKNTCLGWRDRRANGTRTNRLTSPSHQEHSMDWLGRKWSRGWPIDSCTPTFISSCIWVWGLLAWSLLSW
jgi:hypothetical protein